MDDQAGRYERGSKRIRREYFVFREFRLTVIFGDKLQQGGTVVLKQHFFLVAFDAADAHAHAPADPAVGQTFCDEQENLFAARRKPKSGNGIPRSCPQNMQHFRSVVHTEPFADFVEVLVQCPFADAKFLRDGFSYPILAPAIQ